MAVQARRDINNVSFILSGNPQMREACTIEQDAGRTAVLAPKTVMVRVSGSTKYKPMTVADPTELPARMKTGAFGTTRQALQAITDGEFAIPVDGVTLNLTGLDFSDIDAPSDTPAKCVCGVNGGLTTNWDDIDAGEFAITINGTPRNITGIDFKTVAITTLQEVADTISRFTMPYGFRCEYDRSANKYAFVTIATGRRATITAVSAVAGGTGDDISGASYLNGLTGTAVLTQGTGGIGATPESVINEAAAGRFRCEWAADDDAYVFISRTAGQGSTVGALAAVAAGAGTDISASGYLNGRTGTAVLTVSTGYTSENVPVGIYIGDEIAAAALVAGDITNCPILVGGPCNLDSSQIVLENSLTLATVIVPMRKTIEDALLGIGLTPETCVNISEYENT